MTSEVFLDTSYAVALAAESDVLNARAQLLADELVAAKSRILTTQAVLLEIGNSLSKRRFRCAAVEMLSYLSDDPTVEVVLLTND